MRFVADFHFQALDPTRATTGRLNPALPLHSSHATVEKGVSCNMNVQHHTDATSWAKIGLISIWPASDLFASHHSSSWSGHVRMMSGLRKVGVGGVRHV